MVVNSLTTSPAEGQRFDAGQSVDVSGIAWDGGYGIRAVEVSTDDGKTWHRRASAGMTAVSPSVHGAIASVRLAPARTESRPEPPTVSVRPKSTR